jgi:ring-1,2-phenylacetyl-CoA epoxidase subunit PaaB
MMTATDTQWTRYRVFLQEKKGEAHVDAGTVHAPDPEMALQNGRDVFVRRPACFSLWVVPEERIFSRTRQQIEQDQVQARSQEKSGPGEIYHVFNKARAVGSQRWVGQVKAASPVQALQLALEKFPQLEAFVWSVFPARLVVESQEDDVESMFAPAEDKPFRLSTDFHTLTTMRNIMQDRQEDDH